MKQKLFVLAISCILLPLLLCTSCGTPYQEAIDTNKNIDYANGYFTVVTEWNDSGNVYRIVYANDTKVKYLIFTGGNRYGITPLYNTDGTLQVYEEDKEWR